MRSKLLLTPFVLAAAFVTACDSDSSGPEGQGRLTIQLTDAPGDLAEAHVMVDHFVLIGNGDDEEGSGRVELQPEVSGWIDLLELDGGQVLEMVDEALVETGTYSELRLVLDEAYVVLQDGRIFATAGAELPAGETADGTLKCPSCSQSGFKVKFMDGGLTVDENAVVLIDFDVAQSFGHEAGKSGQWILKPVLRATASTVQLGHIYGNVGLLSGVTLPLCGGATNTVASFRPFAVAGTDTLTGTVAADGSYRISNVMPGTYSLGAWTDISFTNGDTLSFAAAATPASVTVAAGDSATAAYQITTAACR